MGLLFWAMGPMPPQVMEKGQTFTFARMFTVAANTPASVGVPESSAQPLDWGA